VLWLSIYVMCTDDKPAGTWPTFTAEQVVGFELNQNNVCIL